MRVAPIIALLLAAACAPVPTSSPRLAPYPPGYSPSMENAAEVADVAAADALQAFCDGQGGHLARVGKLQALHCIVSYADAGKACTDGAQCLGQRCMGEMKDDAATAAVAGHCVATNDPFGCQTIIRDGKAATLCVD